MRLHRATFVVALAIALISTRDAAAFTPETRALVIERATKLLPDALRRQFTRHARSLYRGALEGIDETGPGHSALDPGDGDAALARAVADATAAVDERLPMREVALRFGRIARVCTDLSFPLHVGPDDPREAALYLDYARFIESRLDRIRVTFAGFEDPRLAQGDIEGFAREVALRARRDYDGIIRSYHPEGRRSVSADFDDRSVAFASASLEVSLAVTATARAWVYAWHEANGDLEGSLVRSRKQPFGPRQAVEPEARAVIEQAEEEKRQ